MASSAYATTAAIAKDENVDTGTKLPYHARLFCGACSSKRVPILNAGLPDPVRVCEKYVLVSEREREGGERERERERERRRERRGPEEGERERGERPP